MALFGGDISFTVFFVMTYKSRIPTRIIYIAWLYDGIGFTVFLQGSQGRWHWATVLCVSLWDCWCCSSSCPAPPSSAPAHDPTHPCWIRKQLLTHITNILNYLSMQYLVEISRISGFLLCNDNVICFVHLSLIFTYQHSALKEPKYGLIRTKHSTY